MWILIQIASDTLTASRHHYSALRLSKKSERQLRCQRYVMSQLDTVAEDHCSHSKLHIIIGSTIRDIHDKTVISPNGRYKCSARVHARRSWIAGWRFPVGERWHAICRGHRCRTLVGIWWSRLAFSTATIHGRCSGITQ